MVSPYLANSRASFNQQTIQFILKTDELSRNKDILHEKPLFKMARFEKCNKNARHAYLKSIPEFSTGISSITH